ncbi:MAG: GCN5-like N-acetyltransferase [Parcubacteria group bacterium Gr01-1014_31]|nr:MAG: GCN5-like N-acetyltransferase [Parcubacteria group bacterium Gr01-1014_31]
MRVPTLKKTDVTLRPLRVSDAPAFCRWLQDPEVTRFLNRHEDPPTLREEREYLRDEQRRADHAQWGIVVERELVGTVALDKIDREHRRAVYGIFIGNPRYWGQGYGTAAGRLVVRFGFRQLKLQRISLLVYVYNTRGYRSYRRLGFRREGRLRNHFYRNGTHHDAFVMGMLRREYLSL